MVLQSLIDSINNMTEKDFSQGGHKVAVYLDPQKGTVYSFVDMGGVPESYFHGIDKFLFEVQDGVILTSVQESLLELTEDLQDVLDCYIGIEWNGSNHIGVWDEEKLERLDLDYQYGVQLVYFTDPSEWYVDQDDMLKAYRDGLTPEQYRDACETYNDGEAVDLEDALSWLAQRWEEFKESEGG